MSSDSIANPVGQGEPRASWLTRSTRRIEHATEVLLQRRRPAWPLAVMRIVYGSVLLIWTLTLALDADDLLGSDALVPNQFATQGRWRYFELDSTTAVWVTLAALVIGSIAIMAGWRPTEWLLLAFVLLVH